MQWKVDLLLQMAKQFLTITEKQTYLSDQWFVYIMINSCIAMHVPGGWAKLNHPVSSHMY